MYNANPSLIRFSASSIIYNNQGIDTLELMPRHTSIIKLIELLGLKEVERTKNTPLHREIKRIQENAMKDSTTRYKKDQLKPIIQAFKLDKGRSLSSYVMVVTHTPDTLHYDSHHKKPKGTFCKVTFAGLHQPTKRLHPETMSVIKKFTDKKVFKLYSLDIATDIKDHITISHKLKKSIKEALIPYANHGVYSPPNGATTLYINEIDHPRISRIAFYDKFLKQGKFHKQNGLSYDLKTWKRCEITVTFDLTKKDNRFSFREYINSPHFSNDLLEINQIVERINTKGYYDDYLTYQISTLLDGRTTNNKESKKRFNSVEALEHFRNSNCKRYTLPIYRFDQF
jgi:hypothetical protein